MCCVWIQLHATHYSLCVFVCNVIHPRWDVFHPSTLQSSVLFGQMRCNRQHGGFQGCALSVLARLRRARAAPLTHRVADPAVGDLGPASVSQDAVLHALHARVLPQVSKRRLVLFHLCAGERQRRERRMSPRGQRTRERRRSAGCDAKGSDIETAGCKLGIVSRRNTQSCCRWWRRRWRFAEEKHLLWSSHFCPRRDGA